MKFEITFAVVGYKKPKFGNNILLKTFAGFNEYVKAESYIEYGFENAAELKNIYNDFEDYDYFKIEKRYYKQKEVKGKTG